MLTRRKFVTASVAVLGTSGAVAALASTASATGTTLNIDLQNNTGQDTVYAYVTGVATDQGGALFLLRADGRTPYYPASPGTVGSPLGADCAIALGPSGAAPRRITVPRLGGGRIWFSVGASLTFLLNPGPALVEPSVTNASDPNAAVQWDFCELTFDSSVLYANISFVDFAALPIALRLTGSAGTQSVLGLPSGGLDTLCAGLISQTAADGAAWNQLVVTSCGKNLRALSPTNGIVRSPSLFSGYFDGYLDQVWQKYSAGALTIDTQAQWGKVPGGVVGGVAGGALTFPGVGAFTRPSSADIFSCNSGPFNVSSPEMGALAARLSAALNRTTLLSDADQPDGENPADYYGFPHTNHYARLVHAICQDHRGYAFPYDDVQPTGGVDQSGAVVDGNPTLLTVTLGAVHGGGTPPPPPPTSPPPPTPTSSTSSPPGAVGAYSPIQAEAYSAQSGTRTEPTTDTGGGQDVAQLVNGNWLRFDNVDFGQTPATQFYGRVASGAPAGVSGLVEARLDSVTGPLIASFAIANTGGWQTWRTVPANTSAVTGRHAVFLTFSSGQPAAYVSVNWFEFGH